jgi:hypothetical protein
MMRGLLQQQPGLGYSTPRSAASPQHGQKTTPSAVEKSAELGREPRAYMPRAGERQQ